jgi:alkanesulfonate monooxygenase SsuD/methylene tetrahydromethanopterin reductase-like flavin-dependent oxidoreductase (luciferase family)
MVAVFVLCAETDDEAERLAASIDVRRLQMDAGINGPIPTLAEANAVRLSESDRMRIRQHRRRAVIGSPSTVRAGLLELRERYAADEIIMVTITGDYPSRLRSYALLADAFELPKGGEGA